MNRLQNIQRLSECFPIKFDFISGINNPADCITRMTSYKQLMKSTYFKGPSLLETLGRSPSDFLEVIVPNPFAVSDDLINQRESLSTTTVVGSAQVENSEHLVPLDKCPNFRRLVAVHKAVLLFIFKPKMR